MKRQPVNITVGCSILYLLMHFSLYYIIDALISSHKKLDVPWHSYCAGKSPVLMTYLNAIDPKRYPNSACPLCISHHHTTKHLFYCSEFNTTLNIQDLWNNPVAVAALLQ